MRPPGTALGFGLISGAGSRRVTEPKPPNFIRKKNKNKKKETKTQRGEKKLVSASLPALSSISHFSLPPICPLFVVLGFPRSNSSPILVPDSRDLGHPWSPASPTARTTTAGAPPRRSSARRSRPARGRPWPRRRPRAERNPLRRAAGARAPRPAAASSMSPQPQAWRRGRRRPLLRLVRIPSSASTTLTSTATMRLPHRLQRGQRLVCQFSPRGCVFFPMLLQDFKILRIWLVFVFLCSCTLLKMLRRCTGWLKLSVVL